MCKLHFQYSGRRRAAFASKVDGDASPWARSPASGRQPYDWTPPLMLLSRTSAAAMVTEPRTSPVVDRQIPRAAQLELLIPRLIRQVAEPSSSTTSNSADSSSQRDTISDPSTTSMRSLERKTLNSCAADTRMILTRDSPYEWHGKSVARNGELGGSNDGR